MGKKGAQLNLYGGMNNIVPPHLLPENQATLIQNLYLDNNGTWRDIQGNEVMLNIGTELIGAVKIYYWKPSRVPADCIDDFVYLVFYSNGTVKLVYRGDDEALSFVLLLKALSFGSPNVHLPVTIEASPLDIDGLGDGSTPASPFVYLSRRYRNNTEVTFVAPASGGTVGGLGYGFLRWIDVSSNPLCLTRDYTLTVTQGDYLIAEYVVVPYIRVENPVGTPITTLGEFTSFRGGYSTTKSYYTGGLNLNTDLLVSPDEYFEISLDEETWVGYGDWITIPMATANSEMTQIYVRYTPPADEE